MFGTIKSAVPKMVRAKSSLPKLASTPNKYNAKSSAFNLRENLPDGLFYHPSPSPMNPEITPKAFLPDSDVRKTSAEYYPEEDVIKDTIQYMPVIFTDKRPSGYKMSAEQVAELQQMRDAGASRREMKKKFPVSDYFINMATTKNAEKFAKELRQQKRVVKRWSARTKQARRWREQRKDLWERDE